MNFDGKTILFVDFETYYDRKAGYDLKSISMTEYLRDPRFHAHGLAYQTLDGERSHWISGDHTIRGWIGSIDWTNTVVVAHNVKFDGAILAWVYGVKPFAWFDTQALGRAVLGENVSGYSLRAMAEYLGLQPKGDLKWDGAKNLTPEQEAEMALYCRGDVDICKGIYEKLISQFPTSQLWSLDWTIRSFVEPRLLLDVRCLGDGVKAEKARREGAIQKSGVSREVLSSNKKFSELLRSRGCSVRTKVSVRTGKSIPAFAKTDAGLGELKDSAPELYWGRIASKSSLLETRGESLASIGRTGPFPFDVNFSGAVQTHRYSGGSGAGGNPQNFTRNSFLRDAVCAPAGLDLVVGDFSSIELRILAWLANEPKLINAIINGVDVYLEFASAFYGRILTKADKAERQFGKCAILGLGYGMGAEKFLSTVKALKPSTGDTPEQIEALRLFIQRFTLEDAEAAITLYRTEYFNVPKLWEFASRSIPLIADGAVGCLFFAPFIKVQKNRLVLPSGLHLQYPNLRSKVEYAWGKPRVNWYYDKFKTKYESEETKLYGGKLCENICQAVAGELCKEAIERAEKAGLRCVGQVHDEIHGISPDGKRDSRVLESAMSTSPTWWPSLRLNAEVGYGPSWSKAKS